MWLVRRYRVTSTCRRYLSTILCVVFLFTLSTLLLSTPDIHYNGRPGPGRISHEQRIQDESKQNKIEPPLPELNQRVAYDNLQEKLNIKNDQFGRELLDKAWTEDTGGGKSSNFQSMTDSRKTHNNANSKIENNGFPVRNSNQNGINFQNATFLKSHGKIQQDGDVRDKTANSTFKDQPNKVQNLLQSDPQNKYNVGVDTGVNNRPIAARNVVAASNGDLNNPHKVQNSQKHDSISNTAQQGQSNNLEQQKLSRNPAQNHPQVNHDNFVHSKQQTKTENTNHPDLRLPIQQQPHVQTLNSGFTGVNQGAGSNDVSSRKLLEPQTQQQQESNQQKQQQLLQQELYHHELQPRNQQQNQYNHGQPQLQNQQQQPQSQKQHEKKQLEQQTDQQPQRLPFLSSQPIQSQKQHNNIANTNQIPNQHAQKPPIGHSIQQQQVVNVQIQQQQMHPRQINVIQPQQQQQVQPQHLQNHQQQQNWQMQQQQQFVQQLPGQQQLHHNQHPNVQQLNQQQRQQLNMQQQQPIPHTQRPQQQNKQIDQRHPVLSPLAPQQPVRQSSNDLGGNAVQSLPRQLPQPHGGIVWSAEVDQAVPQAFTWKEVDEWIKKVRNQPIAVMETGTDSKCGRPPNHYLETADGTKLCARYRNTFNMEIEGELLSFYLARLLDIKSVPPLVLATIDTQSNQWSAQRSKLSQADWKDGKVVTLTKFIPGLHRTKLAKNLHMVENTTPLEVTSPELKSLSQSELSNLVQWTDLVVFDYLLGHIDRVTNHQEGVYLHEETVQNTIWDNQPIHNLAIGDDSVLWFIDNETGFRMGYRALYHNPVDAEKYRLFHNIVLHTTCVFRPETVKNIADLYHQPNPFERLMTLVNENEPLAKWVNVEIPGVRNDVPELFNERLASVYKWMEECRQRVH